MKKAPVKIIFFFIALVGIVAIAASSFAFAYWNGAPQQEVSGNDAAVVDNSTNATSHYLVYAPVDSFAKDFCFEYTDANGWVLKYEYGSDYSFEGGQHPAGSRNAASAADISTVSASLTALKVIGYIGTLGQFENLIIESSITWNSVSYPVTQVEIKMTEYKESMDLITGVEIPSSITAINGGSFTAAGNLSKVYFNSTSLPATISTDAFVGINATYYKKNGSGEYITTNLR